MVTYSVLTAREVKRGLTYSQMKTRIEVYKELRIPYQVIREVEITKVVLEIIDV